MAYNVLIADDDPQVRDLLRKLLLRDAATKALGLNIFEAKDGEEGMRVYKEHRPQLCIIDLLMPKLDGFGMCERIRALDEGVNVPIAVISGVYKDSKTITELTNRFGATFFAKPAALQQLPRFVARRLRGLTDSAPTQSHSGTLERTNVSRLFLKLLESEVSGRLLLRQGHVMRQIDLARGCPTSVTTNVREETLGHFLVSRNIIDQKTHRLVMAQAAKERIRLGEALLANGILTPQQLVNELRAQTRAKLANVLRWSKGTWRLQPQSPHAGSKIDALDMRDLVVRGLGATTAAPTASALLQKLAHRPLSLNSRGNALLPYIGTIVSPSFAEHMHDNTTTRQLLDLGIRTAELCACLDVLITTGGLVIGQAPVMPQAVREAAMPQVVATATRQEVATSAFATGDMDRTTGQLPLEVLDHTTSIKAITQEELLKLSRERDNSERPVSSSDKGHSEAKELLLRELLRVQGANHYDVLEILTSASEKQVMIAYQAKSTSLLGIAASDSKEVLRLRDAIKDAYEQAKLHLSSSEKRREYDATLARSQYPEVTSPSLDADIEFRLGEECLTRKDLAAALRHIRNAVDISPSEPTYLATMGWLLFLEGKQTRTAALKAMEFVDKALAVDPNHGTANSYKGRVLWHGFFDKAQAIVALELALQTDPRLESALEALSSLRLESGEVLELCRVVRHILFRVSGTDAKLEASLWRKLGELHKEHTKDLVAARIAFGMAAKVAMGSGQKE